MAAEKALLAEKKEEELRIQAKKAAELAAKEVHFFFSKFFLKKIFCTRLFRRK